MHNSNYSGSLTAEQFLFFEITIVARMLSDGMNRDEISSIIMEQNLFQFPTERMIKRIVKACFRRLDCIESEFLIEKLANSSAEVAKQINLYAIMCENSIVYDFMTDVIGEKYRSQELDFSAKDVNVFFMELAEKVPAVNRWSDSTIKKLKQVLVRFLVECEYIENIRSDKLFPVYLYPELEAVIREKNDTAALAAFYCFS